MKKIHIVIIFVMFFMMPYAYALCSPKNYTDLQAKAFSSSFKWDFYKNNSGEHYFTVTLYNLDKDVMLKYRGREYISKNRESIVLNDYFSGGAIYQFELFGGYDSECPEENLYTKSIEIPKYNIYSEKSECIEYEEFPLCNKWYKGVINSDKEFNDNLDAYKKSKEVKKEIKEVKEQSIFDKIISLYNENKLVFTISIVVIILIIVYVVVIDINNRRKRVKIEIDG